MNFTAILHAVLVLGILGAVFGFVLAYASKIFAVSTDERRDLIIEALPGANCGGCGYPGCSSFADAIIAGNAPVTGCPVGGAKTGAKVAEIMGVSAEESVRKVALVKCSGGINASRKFTYIGPEDCVAALRVGGNGPLDCSYGCLGMGTCVDACKFDALSIVDGVALVDREKCTGCMKCLDACPRGLISMVPYDSSVHVACSSKDKGGILRSFCNIGCIGCKICEKTCQYDAIHVKDNLAQIDYTKCTHCGDCAAKCPRHLITYPTGNAEKAV